MRQAGLIVCTVVLGLALVAMPGCGGSSHRDAGPVAPQFGGVNIRIDWPERPEGVDSALIPAASNSIKVELLQNGVVLAENVCVIDRPETEGRIDDVPVGVTVMRAAAYPLAGAGGVPQASGERAITVLDGQYTEWPLTLESTISEVSITPSPAEVEAEEQLQLTATALDSDGRTVLVPATDPFEWSVTPDSMAVAPAEVGVMPAQGTPSGSAVISGAGLLTGRSIGPVTVTAQEKESLVSGQRTVNVLSQVYEIVWRVTPGSSWVSIDRRIAAGSNGVVHIPDRAAQTIVRFDSDGNRLTDLGYQPDYNQLEGVTMSHPGDTPGAVYISVSKTGGPLVRRVEPTNGDEGPTWGTNGAGPGQFYSGAQGMTFGPGTDPTLYVADYGNHRVQRFGADGTYRGQITQSTFDASGGWQPYEVAVDAVGNIYVRATEYGVAPAYQIEKYDDAGNPLGWWGKDTEGAIGWHAAGGSVKPAAGDEPGAFTDARQIAVDSDGYVYVGDFSLGRMSKLKVGPDGGVVAVFSDNVSPWEFEKPQGVAVTTDGAVYVCGTRDSLLRKFQRVMP